MKAHKAWLWVAVNVYECVCGCASVQESEGWREERGREMGWAGRESPACRNKFT